eukprot:9425425-Pyramimonas_sp.AAC.1
MAALRMWPIVWVVYVKGGGAHALGRSVCALWPGTGDVVLKTNRGLPSTVARACAAAARAQAVASGGAC